MTIDGDTITIVVDGELVLGRIVHLSERDIAVALGAADSSGKPLATGSHIPVPAAAHLRFEEDGAITDRGRERAEQLLHELHRAHRIPSSTRSRLAALYASELARRTPPGALDDEGFQEARRALRKAVKAGTLVPKDYQRELAGLEERREGQQGAESEALEVVADHIRSAHGLTLGDELVRELLGL